MWAHMKRATPSVCADTPVRNWERIRNLLFQVREVTAHRSAYNTKLLPLFCLVKCLIEGVID